MSATTDQPSLRIVPFRAPTARLALKTVSTSRGPLDGAWWPRSRDLTQELPALADVLDPLSGRITRIAVNATYWPAVPRRVPVNGHVVKVGWFTIDLDPHKILLLSHTTGSWNLLVIPPETSAPAADRLMAAASDSSRSPTTASALMAAEHALLGSSMTDVDQDSEESREDGDDASSHRAAAARPGGASRAGRRRTRVVGSRRGQRSSKPLPRGSRTRTATQPHSAGTDFRAGPALADPWQRTLKDPPSWQHCTSGRPTAKRS
ncbi:DUF5994 family protein [Streptomyces sp. NPDC002306]